MTKKSGRGFYSSPGFSCSPNAAHGQFLYFLRRHEFVFNLNYLLNVYWMPWIRLQLFSQTADCVSTVLEPKYRFESQAEA